LIGLIESLSGLFVSPQWSSLVVFSVLFIYLVLRPLDLRAFRVQILSAMPDPARGE
jgi:branched-subunit amino acid ABC-type transport system permease component